jgi:hypothetical protein
MRIPLSQIETFDTTPNKLKFHWRERKNNTRQEIAVERMYYHTIDLWKECEFFIKDHVGCGFNKTFKEWCKRHKKIENGINTREYFKKQLWDKTHNYYYGFYLDENNIIRQRQYKRPRKPSLTIVESESEIVYEVNKKALQLFEIKRYLKEHLDNHTFDMLYNNRFITYKQYRSLFNKPNTVSLNELSIKVNYFSSLYWVQGIFYEKSHILNYIDKQLQPLFKEKILYGVKQIYRGEKEYKRHFAEQEDQNKKIERERKKRIIENKENLLHRIEEKRKWEKEKNDIIDRDRLGFDENSFKGEAYHGQKRKKRKNKTTQTTVVENQTNQS